MSKQLTIARPYAKALFEEALADGTMHDWSTVLTNLAMIARDTKTQQFISNPKVSDADRVELFSDVLSQLVPSLNDLNKKKLSNFIQLLTENQRLNVLPDIAELYLKMLAEQEGVVNVSVFSADALEQEQKNSLQKVLEQRFGSKVKMKFEEDASLIGGVLIRSDNWVLDGSVKGKLARLTEALR